MSSRFERPEDGFEQGTNLKRPSRTSAAIFVFIDQTAFLGTTKLFCLGVERKGDKCIMGDSQLLFWAVASTSVTITDECQSS